MVLVDNSVWNILNDAPTASVIKVFFFIATNQPDDGLQGLKTTKEQLAFNLKLGRAIIFRSLKWLKDNMLIQEIKFVDEFDYMANPSFVMNNADFQERLNEWNRRCQLDIQREIKLKRRRLLKQAKLQKK